MKASGLHTYKLWSPDTCDEVYIETNTPGQEFAEALHTFLVNDYEDNSHLTPEMFADSLVQRGYVARVLRPVEMFYWWIR